MRKFLRSSVIVYLLFLLIPELNAQYTFDQLMNFGVRSDEKGEYVAAIASLDQAVELKPNDDMAWLTRGVVRVHMKDYGSAVVDFNKAILLNPNRTETYLYRYIAYRETENYQFAFSDINTYVNAMPKDTMARIQRMQLSLMLSEYETMNTDVAWLYEKVGDALFADYSAMYNDHFEKHKHYNEYAKILIPLLEKYPNSQVIKYQLMLAHFQLAQYEPCLKLLNDLLQGDSKGFTLERYKADALFFLNRMSEAETLYADLLSYLPTDADLMADYGHCLLQLEKWNDADMWLSKSIKAKNNTPAYAYLGRGIARYNLGKAGLACADWERSYLLGEKSAKKWLEMNCQTK